MHFTAIQKPLLASAFFSALQLVAAAPQLAFPINSQVPPVAYASQPYSFVFSATTFVSSAPQISYTIADGPKWLDLDSTSRQFSGIPDKSDVGASTFQLVASDATGRTTTSITFVVISSQDLYTDAPVLPQLVRSGPVSSPNTLFIRPQETFNVSFDENTFGGASSVTIYHAVSTDDTPLPSWVQFDASQLLFSGRAPASASSLAGPQSYGLRLITSNVPGFSEAAIDFNIVISSRVLGFSAATQNISVSPGVHFQSQSLRSLLTLDGHPARDDQLATVDSDAPSWIEFDKNNISLSGVPAGPVNTTVTITVMDIHGDTAKAMISLLSTGYEAVQLGSLADLNITTGKYFSYSLVTPAFSPSIRATAELGAASSWLNFDRRSWTLSGAVPIDQASQALDIPITFENGSSTAIGDITLRVSQSPGATATTSTQTVKTQSLPQATTTSTAFAPNASDNNQKVSSKYLQHLIIAIVFAIFGLLVVLLLILWCLRRRKQRHRGSSKTSEEASAVVIVRGPSPQITPSYDTSATSTLQRPRAVPPRPPRVDLAWSNGSIRQSRQRLSALGQPGPLSYHRTSQSFLEEQESHQQSQRIQDLAAPTVSSSEPIFTYMERLPHLPTPAVVGRPSTSGRQGQSRSSLRLSQQSILPPLIGLPDRRSGAGHGSGILPGPADGTSSRISWRNSWTTNGSVDPRRTTVVLQSFPVPPGDESTPARSPSKTKRSIPLLRVVSEDSDEPVSFEEQRQRWHTERARSRLEGSSRFSNAGSARITPSPQTMWRVRSDTLSDARPGVDGGPSREHSWSKWSGIGPAAPESAILRTTQDSIKDVAALRSKPSIASSGQFESVASSDSQWEDENLTVEETAHGGRRWQADNGSSQASPRLPFSPVPASREHMNTNHAMGEGQQHTLVADRRKHVSVEEGGLKRSHGSQRGSFRFI